MVKYAHLEPKDAIKCLQSLVTGIKVALDELHSIDIAHNVQNICFDENYQVKLIDIDRLPGFTQCL